MTSTNPSDDPRDLHKSLRGPPEVPRGPRRDLRRFLEGPEGGEAPDFNRIEWTADNTTVLMIPSGWYSPLPRSGLATLLAQIRYMCDKHFVKHNNEKTKVVWIQKRLISKCRDEEE